MTRITELYRTLLNDFFGLDPDSHADLIQAIETVELPGGRWLFQQGDPGDSMYFLVRGRLEAWQQNPDGRASRLNEIVAGEAVGEIGLLTDAPRSAGVRARRDSLLFRVDRATLDALAKHHPQLALRISTSIAGRLARVTRPRYTQPVPDTLALVILEDAPDLLAWSKRLSENLCADGQGLALGPETLAGHGAPDAESVAVNGPTGALKQWLAEQEDAYRRVIFLVRDDQPGWGEYALRQADRIVLLAGSQARPDLRPIEAHLDQARSGPTYSETSLVLWHRPGSTTITGTDRWLDLRPAVRALHVRADFQGDHARLVRLLTGRATGLVLSGGAMRGLAHLGVIRAMEELRIPIDWVGGTSMGAIMAACAAMGWSSEQAITEARQAFLRGRPLSDYTLPLISLLRGRRMQRLTQQKFPCLVEDMPIPLFTISANLNNGDINVHERGPASQALLASASLPGLYPPIVYDWTLTIDGAVINNLPVDIMQQRPVGRVIAVSLDADRERQVEYDRIPSPWAVLGSKLWPFGRRARVPTVTSMMLKAIELGTRKRVRELGARADLLIRPAVQRFSLTDVKQCDELIEVGYRDGLEALQTALRDHPDWAETTQPK